MPACAWRRRLPSPGIAAGSDLSKNDITVRAAFVSFACIQEPTTFTYRSSTTQILTIAPPDLRLAGHAAGFFQQNDQPQASVGAQRTPLRMHLCHPFSLPVVLAVLPPPGHPAAMR